VNELVYIPAVAKITALGLATELVLGVPPRNTHEYPVIDPLDAVPEPENVTDCPGAIRMSDDGLVIFPTGGTSAEVFETCTNFATEGTPDLFTKKSM
jgi:hypothetical protein